MTGRHQQGLFPLAKTDTACTLSEGNWLQEVFAGNRVQNEKMLHDFGSASAHQRAQPEGHVSPAEAHTTSFRHQQKYYRGHANPLKVHTNSMCAPEKLIIPSSEKTEPDQVDALKQPALPAGT